MCEKRMREHQIEAKKYKNEEMKQSL
jgi:hypothetical protein